MFQKAKYKAVTALNLPGDVVLGDALLYFTGNRSLVIVNYRSIVKYEDLASGKKIPYCDAWKAFVYCIL